MRRNGVNEKSVYSLVLSDEVIRAVDRLAYQMNTSRSNMINQILAEYTSLLTPQKRMETVFEEIQNLLSGTGFQLLMKPSDSMLSLRQALNYKYNPTVRYSIELNQSGSEAHVRLKVLLRSQNRTLIHYLNQFFNLWQQMEQKLGGVPLGWSIEDTKYVRELRLPEEEVSDEDFGQQIAAYIQTVDQAMNTFFDYLDDPKSAVLAVEKIYHDYLTREGGNL